MAKKENYDCHLKKRQCKSIILNPSDECEIIEAINGLKCHKSPGYIDVPVKLIKHAKSIIASYLKRSFNSCIEKGYYPDQLKIAKVIPLDKSGSKTEVGNYRPISILSPINKIFETLLHKRLIAYWEKFNLFSNHQFGFRKKHSTNLAILDYIETILDLRDKNNIVSSTFIDIRKAFDSVNHKILLDKLEHNGVRGQTLQLFTSYLSNRMQYISVNDNHCSSMIPVTCGVPQGSILGPFLFLVYINDLPTCTDSKMILYADDAVLICQDKSIHALKTKTGKELKNVKSWVASNKLSLNFDKTHCMLYSNKNKPQKHDFVLDIDGKKLFPETSTKYLGIILDENLNWAEHLQYVSKKLSIAGGIMYRLQHYLTPKLLKQVYYSIAYPHLQYAITSWGKAPATYINRAQVQQNRLIRILFKSYEQKVKLSS